MSSDALENAVLGAAARLAVSLVERSTRTVAERQLLAAVDEWEAEHDIDLRARILARLQKEFQSRLGWLLDGRYEIDWETPPLRAEVVARITAHGAFAGHATTVCILRPGSDPERLATTAASSLRAQMRGREKKPEPEPAQAVPPLLDSERASEGERSS